jgi:adenylate cyclase
MCSYYRGIEIPDNDSERVAALRQYDILDTEPEPDFDDVTELATSITGCKISYIGFYDDKRLWLKSKYGLPPDLIERPRELTLCSQTICQSDLLVIPDMSKNSRYAELPTVKNPPHAKFYCAMPLINSDGFALGTLCVWDTEVIDLAPEKQQCMRRLARQLMTKLEYRRQMIALKTKYDLALCELDKERRENSENKAVVKSLFPASIADQVVAGEAIAPRFYPSATIMFVDFEGFTNLSETIEPRALIDQLSDYFSLFDRIIARHNLEKIKTIGDGYLAVGGLPVETSDHAKRVCSAALEIRDAIAKRNAERTKLQLPEWPIRIGIHSGSAIAGTVGASRLTYDIWGDGVNVAARMQQECEPGSINVSEGTVGLISDEFDVEPRGEIEAKNKGFLRMYYLLGPT